MNAFSRCFPVVMLSALLLGASASAKTEKDVPLPLGIDNIISLDSSRIVHTSSHLHLELVAQPKYALGEPIEVTMRYTLDGAGKLAVKVVDFDRSGRVVDYRFWAWDSEKNAVRDPVGYFFGSAMGGPFTLATLSQTQPFEQKVVANQWLAFDKPGTYFLVAQSNIMHPVGEELFSSSGLTVESEPIQIEITAPDEAKRNSRLALAKDVVAIEDREIDQTNRQLRLQTVRELGFMIDERAIPLLVRALNDGWGNLQHEAEMGLRSFKNLAPVKVELLRFINDKSMTVAPRTKQRFLQLLLDSDQQSGIKTTTETVSNYSRMLDEKLALSLKALPLAQSLKTVVEAMDNYQMSRVEAANWNRVLDGAALMSLEAQKKAGELLLNVLTVDPRFDHRLPNESLQKMHDALLKTTRDATIDGILRSSAIVALMRIGDQSQRELLVSEFMKPQPSLWKIDEWGHVWDEAQKALNGYKAQEIALKLLGYLNRPEFFQQDYYAKRSVILRLSDFGGALSTSQLVAATKRVIEYSKDDQQNEEMLRALSLKSPDDAIRLIEKLPAGAPKAQLSFEEQVTLRTKVIASIVSRTDTRLARNFIHRLFRSNDEREHFALISGFATSIQDARDRSPLPERGLPIRPDLVARYFPQILHAFQTDTSREVRATAFYTLDYLIGVPGKRTYELKDADEQKYIPQWQAWWKKNKLPSIRKAQ